MTDRHQPLVRGLPEVKNKATFLVDAAPNQGNASAAMKNKLILYVDAAANRYEKVVNSYGKKLKGSNGWKIGIVSEDGEIRERATNTQATNSLAAEAYGILKAVEIAAEKGVIAVVIHSDAIGSLESPASEQGDKYLWVARKIAADNNLAVTIARVAGSENPADAISREVTTLTAKGAQAGTIEALLEETRAYGQAKTKLRSLAKKQGVEVVAAKWADVSARPIKKADKVATLIAELS